MVLNGANDDGWGGEESLPTPRRICSSSPDAEVNEGHSIYEMFFQLFVRTDDRTYVAKPVFFTARDQNSKIAKIQNGHFFSVWGQKSPPFPVTQTKHP